MNDEDYICLVCQERIGLNPWWMNSNDMTLRSHVECVDQLLEEFFNARKNYPYRTLEEVLASARMVMVK